MIFKILMTLFFAAVCVPIMIAGIGVLSESDDYLISTMDTDEEKKHWAQTHRRNRPPGGSEEA